MAFIKNTSEIPTAQNASTYGSDSSGLICGFSFTSGGHGKSIDCAAAAEWLQRASAEVTPEFIWLHFSLSNLHSLKWMQAHLPLPEHYYETLHEAAGSTHIELVDDALIAVINDVKYDFGNESSEIATLWMCVQHNLVISVRRHPLRSIDRLRLAATQGEHFLSPVSLLAHLLRDQAETLLQIIRDAGARQDNIEDNLLIGRLDTKRGTLGYMRRVFVRLRRLLAPEPGALFRLLNRPPSWFDEEDARDLRIATEEFSEVLNILTSLQERAKLLQEEISAHVTEQTNRSVFVLTVVTVIALPINIIAGMLGMNVGGIPLAQDANGFWVIAAIVAVFTALAVWFAFFRRRE